MQTIFKLFPFLVIFFASLYNSADLDLGWHLKYGEYFIKTGQILRDNTFSTIMPGFHYINTSWASDIIEYLAFAKLGFLGITLLGAAIITLTFIFFSKAFKLTLWDQT